MFLELSSTMPIAAIAAAKQQGLIAAHDTVVAVVTASGLKDVDRSASSDMPPPFDTVSAALAEFAV